MDSFDILIIDVSKLLLLTYRPIGPLCLTSNGKMRRSLSSNVISALPSRHTNIVYWPANCATYPSRFDVRVQLEIRPSVRQASVCPSGQYPSRVHHNVAVRTLTDTIHLGT